jgi:hypothetical protein
MKTKREKGFKLLKKVASEKKKKPLLFFVGGMEQLSG